MADFEKALAEARELIVKTQWALLDLELAWGEEQDKREREEKKEEERKVDKERINKEIEEREKNSRSNLDSVIEKQQIDQEFETLWERYPRKQGRKDAFRHYSSARRNGVTYETISAGLDRYCNYIKRNDVKPQYIKMGSSWFCQQAWDDELRDTSKTASGFKNFSERETDYDALLRKWEGGM